MNETLRTVDGRAVLRIERRLSHPPEKVWRALTDPAHLSQWYPFTARELEPQVGGKIVFDDGEGTVTTGAVTEFDPPSLFEFTEDPGEAYSNEGVNLLRFELRPDGDGCLLVFTHVFDDLPHAAANASGWLLCLDALDQVLDGRPVGEPDEFVELHERYIERFGLDQGTVEATTDGWRLRFDRQLMGQPVEQVWAALNGSAATVPAVGDAPPSAATTGEVPAGTVTAVATPTLLEYGWQVEGRTAGRVRWELSSSPAGARITLIQTGPLDPTSEQPTTASAAWRTHIQRLVRQVMDTAAPAAATRIADPEQHHRDH